MLEIRYYVKDGKCKMGEVFPAYEIEAVWHNRKRVKEIDRSERCLRF